MKDLLFGTQKTTSILDNEGSTKTVEKKIVNGVPNKPLRHYYEVRKRVHDQKEEHTAYIEFSDDIRNDKSKLEPAFRIEHNTLGNDNGFYYVVQCYTQLEY